MPEVVLSARMIVKGLHAVGKFRHSLIYCFVFYFDMQSVSQAACSYCSLSTS